MPSRLENLLYVSGLRSARGLTLPDFLGIGAQKAGTTWLYENLRRHPGLFLPEPKELHYFDQHFEKPLAWYADHFRPAGDRKKGEITPAYGVLEPERVRFIRRIMPDVRLIFILRNPIERAWSQAVMNLVVQPNRAYGEVPEEQFMEHFRTGRALVRGDYVRTLDTWLSFFPQEQLYAGFFENVKERPTELLSEVLSHLDVPQPESWEPFPYREVVFKGPDHPLPEHYRQVLSELYRPQIELLRERFGPRVERWLCGAE